MPENNDFLIRLGANKRARKMVGRLGLPIPLPQDLRRGKGPWAAHPLAGRKAAVGGPQGQLHGAIAPCLAELGLEVEVGGPDPAPYQAAGEAWSRPVTDSVERPDALVFDASGLDSVEDLGALYDFFHARIRGLGKCGRVVVLGRPDREAKTIEEAAARSALLGFVKAVGKEIGRKGSTANLIWVEDGAEDRVAPVLRWFLSDRSAFVSGQVLTVSNMVSGDVGDVWTRPLDGRIALVTGAARGIGAETARRLAEEGAKVVCVDLGNADEKLSELARAIGGIPVVGDVTATDEIAAQIAEAAGGPIDIVVHNAGITRDKTLAKMDRDKWDLTLDVNLSAIVRLTEKLELADGAHIVLLSSVSGIAGNVGQSNYSASKRGVVGLVDFWAPRMAERGITVNAIAPGFIETRLTAAVPVAIREGGRRLSALSQGGLPVDIAETVTFFASPGSVGVTGQVLRVCGLALIGA